MPEQAANATVSLFDISGRTVISQALTEDTRINIEDLPAGIYGYMIEQNNNRYSGKVMVE